jgi:hypothetical protein
MTQRVRDPMAQEVATCHRLDDPEGERYDGPGGRPLVTDQMAQRVRDLMAHDVS